MFCPIFEFKEISNLKLESAYEHCTDKCPNNNTDSCGITKVLDEHLSEHEKYGWMLHKIVKVNQVVETNRSILTLNSVVVLISPSNEIWLMNVDRRSIEKDTTINVYQAYTQDRKSSGNKEFVDLDEFNKWFLESNKSRPITESDFDF